MYEPICGYGNPIRKKSFWGPSVGLLQSGNISFTIGRKNGGEVRQRVTEDFLSPSHRLHGRHRPVAGWHRPAGLRPEAGTQTGRSAETGIAGRRLRVDEPQQLGGQVPDAQQDWHSAACAGEQQLHHCEGTRRKKTINTKSDLQQLE